MSNMSRQRASKPWPHIYDEPAYGITDAARYLLLPSATLRSWVVGRDYPTKRGGKRRFEPLIEIAAPGLLSFRNLAEAHVLASLRRDHHVNMGAVRTAVKHMREKLGNGHPLVNPDMVTNGISIFVKWYLGAVSKGERGFSGGQPSLRVAYALEDVSASGQWALGDVLDASLRRLDWDISGPVRLFPFTRRGESNEPKLVVIDPLISFGKPVLVGTGISTATIAERYKAGESIEELARDYERDSSEIQEAIRCELLPVAA